MANSSRAGRIGRSQYWTAFALYFAAVIALGAAAIYFLVTLNIGLMIVSLLLVAPLGIYFRVVMMRRCRDIGWPAVLPWLIFGASMVVGMFGSVGTLQGLGGEYGDPTSMKTLLVSAGLPLLLSLVDLGFSITIGCFRSKDEGGEDYARIFGDEGQPAKPMWPRGSSEPALPAGHHEPDTAREPAPAGDYSRFDQAVARALEARRSGGTADPAPRIPRGIDELDPRADAPIAANAHARAVAGFGRKMV